MHLVDYDVNTEFDEEMEIAAKVKTIDSAVANPQYMSVEERHIYDVVGRDQNPYEEIQLQYSPAHYNKLGGQQYANPPPLLPSVSGFPDHQRKDQYDVPKTPQPPSIPSFPDHQWKEQYDVPKNNSFSSSVSPISFTVMSDARD